MRMRIPPGSVPLSVGVGSHLIPVLLVRRCCPVGRLAADALGRFGQVRRTLFSAVLLLLAFLGVSERPLGFLKCLNIRTGRCVTGLARRWRAALMADITRISGRG